MVRIGKVRSSGDMARLPLISLLKIISFNSLKIRYHIYESFVKLIEKRNLEMGGKYEPDR